MMTLAEFQALVEGRCDRIVVCEVDATLAYALGSSSRTLYLARRQLQHLIDEHADMDTAQFMLLPHAVAAGLVIHDRERPLYASICYQGPIDTRRYIVSIKTNKIYDELWVASFHRCRERQTKSMLRRGRIIRMHRI